MRGYILSSLTMSVFVSGFQAFAQEKSVAPLKLENRPFTESFQNGASDRPAVLRATPLKERREKSNWESEQRRRQWEENAAYWRGEVERDPGTLYYYQRLLYSLKRINRCDEIWEVADRLLRIDPLNAYALSAAGICYYEHNHYDKAIEYLQRSACYNPSDFQTQRELGYSLYQMRRYQEATVALQHAINLRPSDFGANYWLGWSFMKSKKDVDAVEAFGHAARLRPTDFWANHWSGYSLLRVGRYHEAIANLEKAVGLRKDAQQTKILLFTTYLIAGEFSKAAALFPFFVAMMAVVLTGGYLLGLAPLLVFSFRRTASEYPNVFLSIGWLVVFMVGQIAFIFLLARLPGMKLVANPLGAVVLSGLPVLAATVGFMSQRWGEPFRWRVRFGGAGVVLGSILLLIGTYLCNFLLAQLVHNEGPLQNTVPIFQDALHSSPWIAYLIMAVAIPAIEEILFRGLLFGSLRKWLASMWTVIVTALIFAAFHLQPAAFIQLFLLGCLLGWARARTGSVALPILLHVLNNSLAAVALLSGKVG
jgi:membrane protease YdiL (CAAX protease family)/Flp pilus assembly protein TadD